MGRIGHRRRPRQESSPTSETIVAVNRDPDAPIAEFADLLVIGDLFEVGPALVDELRARKS